MLIRNELTDEGGMLGIWRMDESPDDLLLILPEELRANAVKQIEEMRSERRIIEWLSTRVLLFMLAGKDKNISNRANGKPYLQDGSFQISISHTKDYVAILLHVSRPVGIDIEILSDRVGKVAHKFIAEDEYVDPSQKTLHQLLHWSAKETLFKLMDEEEIFFKRHLHIHPFNPADKGVMRATETKTTFLRAFDIHYEALSDYVLTWLIDSSNSNQI